MNLFTAFLLPKYENEIGWLKNLFERVVCYVDRVWIEKKGSYMKEYGDEKYVWVFKRWELRDISLC